MGHVALDSPLKCRTRATDGRLTLWPRCGILDHSNDVAARLADFEEVYRGLHSSDGQEMVGRQAIAG